MTIFIVLMALSLKIVTIISILIISLFELILCKTNAIKASKKLKKYNLIKIAITGSYGKTSVKHILKTILSEKYSVLISPKSYNTVNGFSLTINKNDLQKYDAVIMEMGAKKKGDIEELCKYFQPQYGILTAIGKQHLESFKDIETIINTKAELQNFIFDNGKMFFNCDCTYVKEQYELFGGHKISIGLKNSDIVASNIRLSETDTNFDVYIGEEYYVSVETILLGLHNVINLLMAIAVAKELGLSALQIKRGVCKVREIYSRMERSITSLGALVINNGYNSNPDSANASLNLLCLYSDKRKIIITPGFVEMGKEQYELNRIFAENISRLCDVCYVVNKVNRVAFVETFNKLGFKNFVIVDKFKEIDFSNFGSNDVVLIENDLPDNYV